MTEEQKVADATLVETKQELPEGNAVETKELTPVEKELAELKAQQAKDAELLKKLRKFERENKEAAEKALTEQGKFRELYEAEKAAREAIEGKVKAKELESAIKAELAKAKAKAPDTVLKLVDKAAIQWLDDGQVDSKSIEKALKELKRTDPILFEDDRPQSPEVKRAVEGEVIGGLEAELRNAKTIPDIEKILSKYGK